MSQSVQQVVGGQVVQVQGQVVSGTQVVNSAGQVVMSTTSALTNLSGQQLVTQLVPSQAMTSQVVHQAPLTTSLASALSQTQVVSAQGTVQHVVQAGQQVVQAGQQVVQQGQLVQAGQQVVQTAQQVVQTGQQVVPTGQQVVQAGQQVVQTGQQVVQPGQQVVQAGQQVVQTAQQVVASGQQLHQVPVSQASSGSGSSQLKPAATTQAVPAPSASSNATADTSTPVLNKQRITELVREVDPNEQLEEEVEEMLLCIADDFIESTVNAACRLARHRGARQLDVRDVQMYLERNWHMWLPGFGTEELRPYKRAPTTEAHKQRLAIIRKAIKKY